MWWYWCNCVCDEALNPFAKWDTLSSQGAVRFLKCWARSKWKFFPRMQQCSAGGGWRPSEIKMSVHQQWADRAGKSPSVIISTDPAVFELQGYQRGMTQQEQWSQKTDESWFAAFCAKWSLARTLNSFKCLNKHEAAADSCWSCWVHPSPPLAAVLTW